MISVQSLILQFGEECRSILEIDLIFFLACKSIGFHVLDGVSRPEIIGIGKVRPKQHMIRTHKINGAPQRGVVVGKRRVIVVPFQVITWKVR